jgi:hypothetical protein
MYITPSLYTSLLEREKKILSHPEPELGTTRLGIAGSGDAMFRTIIVWKIFVVCLLQYYSILGAEIILA